MHRTELILNNLKPKEHTVISNSILHETLFELTLERRDLIFQAGDCVALYTADGKSRPYSIASGISESHLRFLIRAIPGGEVSSQLFNLTEGNKLELSPPFGWFRPAQEADYAPSVFFATGTGIAPFLSYLNESSQKQPLAIFYGVSHENDIAGFNLLNQVDQLHIATSQQQSMHHHGRITELLDQVPLNSSTHYYCCGREKMIDEISAWLTQKGVELNRIHREVFFHG